MTDFRDIKRQGGSTPPTAVFIHIPKTGGSTIAGIINRQYRKNEIVGVGFNHLASQEKFLAMTDEEKSRVGCLRGHTPFGIQEQLPGPYCLITILRDPVKRFLSEFKHLVGRGSRIVSYPPAALASLDAHLEYRAELNSLNLQTAQISGYLTSGVVDGSELEPLPADALDRAKVNLAAFDVPGVLERFDECLLLMKRKLGWQKSIASIRKNVAVKVADEHVLTPRLRDRIAEHTALDMELYELASQLIDERIRSEGEDFAGELAGLRRANESLFKTQKFYATIFPKKLRRVARKLLGR